MADNLKSFDVWSFITKIGSLLIAVIGFFLVFTFSSFKNNDDETRTELKEVRAELEALKLDSAVNKERFANIKEALQEINVKLDKLNP